MKACSRCGSAVADTAIKCPSCRALLVAPPSVPANSPAPSPQWSGGAAWGPAAYAPPPVTATRSPSIFKRLKTLVKLALAGLAAFFVYSVVVQVHRDNAPYSDAHRKAFVSGCKNAGAAESACYCSFDWMKQHIPGADFTAYVRAVNSPGYTPAQAPAWVYQAGQTCGIHA
jgi:hypothetical protein